jgi:hypothetical protein
VNPFFNFFSVTEFIIGNKKMYFILIYLSLLITIFNVIIKTYIVFNSNKSQNKVKIAIEIYSVIMNFMSRTLYLPILSK